LRMPEKWNEASLENVQVVDNNISVFYKKSGDEIHIKVEQKSPDWKLILEPAIQNDELLEVIEGTQEEMEGVSTIVSEGKKIEIKILNNK